MTTRQIIDARTQPVTITTIPLERSALTVYRPTTQPLPALAPEPVRPRGRGQTVAIVVAATVTAVGTAGFTLGWLGWGLGVLAAAATTVVAALLVYVAFLLASLTSRGHTGSHCPGPWHR